jgi:membrane protease YdiL (CAAX protease family)
MKLPMPWRSVPAESRVDRGGSSWDLDAKHTAASAHRARAALWLFVVSAALVFSIGAYTQVRIDIGLGLAITEILLIGLPALIFLRRHPSLLNAATLARPRVVRSMRLALVGVSGAIGALVLGTLVRRSLGLTPESTAIDSTMSSATVLTLMFSLIVLAPLCEDLLFRVAIQGSLSRALSPRLAVFATSGLFAVYHGALERVPEVLVLGVLLGVVYQRTGSYWQCVVLHLVLNLAGPPLFVIASQVSTPILIGVVPVAILIAVAALPRPEYPGVTVNENQTPLAPRSRSSRGVILAIVSLVSLGLGIETRLHLTNALSRFDASAFPPPGWCAQEWHLGPKNTFRVIERLTLPSTAEPPGHINPIAPDAELVSATIDGLPILYERAGDAWNLRPSERQGTRRCALEWTVPLKSLTLESGVYWLETRAPVPVRGFRVDVVLEPGCGFADAREPSRQRDPVISMNTGSDSFFSVFPRVGFQIRPVDPPAR